MITRLLSLLCLLAFSVSAFAADETPKKKKKKDEYETSKYKSYKVLTGEERTYRFDANGDPIPVKKPKPKKKKKKLSSEDDCQENPEAEACGPKPEGEAQP